MASVIQTGTLSIASTGSSTVPGVSTYAAGCEVLLRATAAGVYLGDGNYGYTSGAAGGFELNANQEYKFTLKAVPLAGNAADNTLQCVNRGGSTVTVSYVVTSL